MFFDALDKIYQAQMDKVLDGPLVGRFQIGKRGKSLIDAGLIEKSLEMMEPFITLEPNDIDDNFRREKAWLYPLEAIRELLINALVHRDWTRFVDVEITGYLDRLEITSPGALPNAMTVEKMLAGQRSARNHILVEVLRDYGYVDARGMGIRAKVIPALKAKDIHYAFEATEDYTKIIVGKASGNTIIAPRKQAVNGKEHAQMRRESVGKASGKILDACSKRSTITIPELAALAGITERSVERNIQKLQKNELLRRVGGRKEGHWEVLK
ncbi:MAG: ATP-binding protein [Mariprofundales bacterium]|nr:ATP-binding protein [Mariprofundales bacterium]